MPTSIADIIDPEVLADQVSAKYPDELVLGRSNLVEVDTTFPLGSPGTVFTIPFWKRISAFSPLQEGTAMVPNKISAGKERAIVQRGGGAYEVYDTASLVSKADPMSEIALQLARRSAEYLDTALVEAAGKTPNAADKSGATLDQDVIIEALIGSLGDNYAKIIGSGALVMHSKVYGDLLKLDQIQNQYQSGMDVLRTGLVPTLLGLPIHVTDRTTVSTVSGTPVYSTFVIGPGALGLFFQRNVKVEFDRDVLMQSDIVVATVHFAPHLFGWDDQENVMAAEDAKSIHCVKIVTK